MKKKLIGKTEGTEIFTYNPQKDHAKLLAANKAVKEGYEEGYMEDLVETLKNEMIKKHITQYALAKKAGIKYQVVSRILHGAPNAEVNTLSKMADTVNLKLVLAKR